MPTDLRKTRKYRGSRTHGWGQVGQHRDSGMKGGHGKAGRWDHKFLMFYGKIKAKKGFVKKPPRKEAKTINLGELIKLSRYFKQEDHNIIINLASLGYDKLLAKGVAPQNVQIIVPSWSKKAEEKLIKVGSVIKKP
ncbi:MAG: uL15 family ribosomal protein [Thermoproteota archaeon]|nr:uL15 family ribosomal protein [Candidatus Brockarchaeota archaeon]MBO3768729.1 uL15 family ribosomal protein [Candidatus Brockarchaeota archaeon]MBO3801043.1 uL15 family ribosomal protein [Candidatus Brockarchaeota archaeon]